MHIDFPKEVGQIAVFIGVVVEYVGAISDRIAPQTRIAPTESGCINVAA